MCTFCSTPPASSDPSSPLLLSVHYSNPSCLEPQSLGLSTRQEGIRSLPGRTHRDLDVAHHQDCHGCQRPRQEPPHAWKSASQELQLNPEDADASPGSWARTGLAHQSSGEPFSAAPLPEGGLSKRHLTSGQQTSPAVPSKKTFPASLPLFFSSLCPHLQPSLASLPALTALKGKVSGLTPYGKVNSHRTASMFRPSGSQGRREKTDRCRVELVLETGWEPCNCSGVGRWTSTTTAHCALPVG